MAMIDRQAVGCFSAGLSSWTSVTTETANCQTEGRDRAPESAEHPKGGERIVTAANTSANANSTAPDHRRLAFAGDRSVMDLA